MHTSIVNVVLVPKGAAASISVNKKLVKTTYYKASGAGGQHRNKTMSGVRLQYAGITVECCEGRDQHQNKTTAFQRLESNLLKRAASKAQKAAERDSRAQNPNLGGRGDFSRNYNYKRNAVTQGPSKTTVDKFMRGKFGGLYS